MPIRIKHQNKNMVFVQQFDSINFIMNFPSIPSAFIWQKVRCLGFYKDTYIHCYAKGYRVSIEAFLTSVLK
jgi:hypothetical protein